MAVYSFVKTKVNSESLSNEIRVSSISIALDYITFVQPSSLDIFFKASLSTGEQTTLNTIVNNHAGEISESIIITKDVFLNNTATYSVLKYVKVASWSTDNTQGVIIPVNKVVGIYRVRLTGADASMFSMLVFDYNGPTQKIISCTRGAVDLYLDPKLAINQVTGNGVKELSIICINDGGNESPYMGGSFEATTISG
jgi:hypothetical protein